MSRVDQEGEPSSSSGPHRMRITSGGQVSGYVNFALAFLRENPGRPLVLHTLPSAPASSSAQQPAPTSSNSSMSSTLLATPKLVSVAEKIKREYMAYINASTVGKGKNKAVGIWQYTESGTLPGPSEQELGLDSILQGKKKPKMSHRPFLQITLSTQPLGLEEGVKGRNVTCQYVMVRRKKAKSKMKSSEAETAGARGVKDDHPTVAVHTEEEAQKKSGSHDKNRAGGDKTKDKGIKRKSESSQPLDEARGGKKRKKRDGIVGNVM